MLPDSYTIGIDDPVFPKAGLYVPVERVTKSLGLDAWLACPTVTFDVVFVDARVKIERSVTRIVYPSSTVHVTVCV